LAEERSGNLGHVQVALPLRREQARPISESTRVSIRSGSHKGISRVSQSAEKTSLISSLRADLQRQFDLNGESSRPVSLLTIIQRLPHPRYLPIVIFRLARACYLARIPLLPYLLTYANIVLFGLEVTPRSEIGTGLFLPHTFGTVIGAYRIGKNATIFQNVTLGSKSLDMGFEADRRPEVGDNVILGAGARVLGGIKIGDGAVVGANSVVTHAVKPHTTVGGIPAREIRAKHEVGQAIDGY
jgi:serine O-acetyltransferase